MTEVAGVILYPKIRTSTSTYTVSDDTYKYNYCFFCYRRKNKLLRKKFVPAVNIWMLSFSGRYGQKWPVPVWRVDTRGRNDSSVISPDIAHFSDYQLVKKIISDFSWQIIDTLWDWLPFGQICLIIHAYLRDGWSRGVTITHRAVRMTYRHHRAWHWTHVYECPPSSDCLQHT